MMEKDLTNKIIIGILVAVLGAIVVQWLRNTGILQTIVQKLQGKQTGGGLPPI